MTRFLVVTALVLAASACPPKPAEDPLPPSGLAGAPGGGATGTGTALPGAGVAVVDAPSGGTPSTSLPAGHPPIAGANTPLTPTGDTAALPPGHPPVDGPVTPTSKPATTGGGSLMGGPSMNPGGAAGADVTVSGPVLESIDVTEYTYMRVKTGGGDTWCAVQKTPVAVGDVVTVSQSLVMTDFFSKSLNRTFPKLVMGMLVGTPKKPG